MAITVLPKKEKTPKDNFRWEDRKILDRRIEKEVRELEEITSLHLERAPKKILYLG